MKIYNERDKDIDRQAAVWGAIDGFIFWAGAGWFLVVAGKMGSIRTMSIMLLVYLAYFVWNVVSSIAALIHYGWRERNE